MTSYLPVADATKVLVAAERIGNVDLALELLGLQRTDPGGAALAAGASLEADVALFLQEHEPESDDDEDDRAMDDISPEEIAEFDPPAENFPDAVSGEDSWEPRATQEAGRPPRLIAHRPLRLWPRPDRAMVAYQLVPDRAVEGQQETQPSYAYESVPDRIQHVQPPAGAPDADAWRVARRLSDAGPRAVRPGRIDLRACVDRIARAEPLASLPRKSASRYTARLELLVDRDVARGVFACDVDELLRAVRSIGFGEAGRVRGIIHDHDDEWLVGDGPIWTYAPFEPADRVWYALVTGGVPADPAQLASLAALVARLGARCATSVVWLGDAIERRTETAVWIPYRAR